MTLVTTPPPASPPLPDPLNPPITPNPNNMPKTMPANANKPSNAQQIGPQHLLAFTGSSWIGAYLLVYTLSLLYNL